MPIYGFFPMKNMAFPSEKKMDQDDHPPKKPRWTPNGETNKIRISPRNPWISPTKILELTRKNWLELPDFMVKRGIQHDSTDKGWS